MVYHPYLYIGVFFEIRAYHLKTVTIPEWGAHKLHVVDFSVYACEIHSYVIIVVSVVC